MKQTSDSLALDHFRAVLDEYVAQLERDVRQRDGIAIEPSSDQVDEVQRASQRALAISHVDRKSKQLREVRAALRRFYEGTYGCCERCEEEISQKRLLAVPWASLCLSCQERLEQRKQVRHKNVLHNAA
jgi:DnaK suppressor protein